MDPEDDEPANQNPYISSRPPFLPPTTKAQAMQALLSTDSLMHALMHPVQPGLPEILLQGTGLTPAHSDSLAGALASHGITSLPDSDPRLVNITTDPCRPAFQTAKGTVIHMNKAGPQTTLPWGQGLERLIRFADQTGAPTVTVNGGSEAQGHGASPLDAHPRNLAIDVAPDPKVSEAVLKQAALAAGYTHGIREIRPGGVVHYHFQVGPENIKGDPRLFDLGNAGPIGTKDYTKAQSPSPSQGSQR